VSLPKYGELGRRPIRVTWGDNKAFNLPWLENSKRRMALRIPLSYQATQTVAPQGEDKFFPFLPIMNGQQRMKNLYTVWL
jgi:hypothetical protein